MARPRTIVDDVVLEAIVAWIAERGYPPSLRELAGQLGFASASSLYPYLRALRSEGRVAWVDGEFRTLRVIGGPLLADWRPASGQ